MPSNAGALPGSGSAKLATIFCTGDSAMTRSSSFERHLQELGHDERGNAHHRRSHTRASA
jgi:hypothetical protein